MPRLLFTQSQNKMAKCGAQLNQQTCSFTGSYEEYLNHTCEVTGHKPTAIEHQDALTNGRASKVAAKALARGEAKQE